MLQKSFRNVIADASSSTADENYFVFKELGVEDRRHWDKDIRIISIECLGWESLLNCEFNS